MISMRKWRPLLIICNKDNEAISFERTWKHSIQIRLKINIKLFRLETIYALHFTMLFAVCYLPFATAALFIYLFYFFFENWMHRVSERANLFLVKFYFLFMFRFFIFVSLIYFFCTKYRKLLSIIIDYKVCSIHLAYSE